MADPVTINLQPLARSLDIPLQQVETAVELLDDGNTVPFITRYRKDRTGGLDEEQLREIQLRLKTLRLLAERKETILRSIEAQGKLSERLNKQILSATTTKRLEDLYLPFKPKKQTLAIIARSRGLELLAQEILSGAVGADQLDARAADFVNTDRQVRTAADALLGSGHILAEEFSENAELRHRLRDIVQRSGKIVCASVGGDLKPGPEKPVASVSPEALAALAEAASAAPEWAEMSPEATLLEAAILQTDSMNLGEWPRDVFAGDALRDGSAPAPDDVSVAPSADGQEAADAPGGQDASDAAEQARRVWTPVAPPEPSMIEQIIGIASLDVSVVDGPQIVGAVDKPVVLPGAKAVKKVNLSKAELNRQRREEKKTQAEQRRQKAFAGYFQYSEEIRRIPPHRVLAINRGERAHALRVKFECDVAAMHAVLDEVCVPAEHPHAEFLRGCARNALTRLVLPSLEREVRRELTDRAEEHAVSVFARNLRNLLLQPPVRDRRVLAIDPALKSGCKLVALDQFGNVLAHELVYLIGRPERRDEAKTRAVELIDRFQLTVIAVGNGTGSRETEEFVAQMLAAELRERGIAYVIVNEAGASVYSTSRVGREEFPHYDATLRGAISIGRRLQDPLSELVKIEPANLGVGLYQHDLKAKHLEQSLDDVVESAVNYVGVDVNTASPALLRYVSGMNQLTARRVYEHRMEHGPFRSRGQLKEVAGFGDATFVQAAGFLKIQHSANPLDATSIHPESYDVARRVLEKLDMASFDWTSRESAAALSERVAAIDAESLAAELQVGVMTLRDILAQLARPGRDPREDLPPPIFRRDVLKLEDLTPGMELAGTVLNVVDFGAFVDMGMHVSGLVHVSRLASRFVRDPHEVIAVGDIVRVWVIEVDKPRRRVSLSMLPPGSPREHGPGSGRPPQRSGDSRPPRSRRSDGQAGPAPGQPHSGRPPRSGQPGGRGPHGPRPHGAPGQQGPGQQGPEGRPADSPEQQGGRPRFERRPPFQGGPRSGGQRGERHSRPPSHPKPLPPITDEMKSGKTPMRTFGDLLQFYGLPGPGEGVENDRRKDHGKNKKKGPAGKPPAAVEPPAAVGPPAAVEPLAAPGAAAPTGDPPPSEKSPNTPAALSGEPVDPPAPASREPRVSTSNGAAGAPGTDSAGRDVAASDGGQTPPGDTPPLS